VFYGKCRFMRRVFLPGQRPKTAYSKAKLIMRRFMLILGVTLLCVSPTQSQTTLDGNSLAYRSTGASCSDKAWRLDENGFVGTYIQVATATEVSFTVRASKSSSDPNTPLVGLRVADFATSWPVTGVGSHYSSHTQTWVLPAGTYCIRVENSKDRPAGGPRAVNVRDLTITGATVLNTATDAHALAAADTYIEHFRKGPATLTVLGDKQPLPNAPVHIRLKRHAFNFGTAVARLTGSGANDVNYRNFVINNFNTVVPENAGKWRWNERTRGVVTLDYLDRIMDFAARNGKRVRMHGVLWDLSKPRWVRALQDTALHGASQAERDAAKADLRAAISNRIQYFVRNRAPCYYELDVINESVHSPAYYEIFGTQGVAGIYNEVKAAVLATGAATRLVTNEFDILQTPGKTNDPYANWYRRHIEALRAAGGAVDGIGIQYYAVDHGPGQTNNAHSPSRIAQVFHNLATVNLPLSLSEFGVQDSGATTPERTAGILADTVRLCFGHEKMTTFINWGFWSSRMWRMAPAAALVDGDWNLTPAGKVWQQLLGVRNWAIPNLPTWTTDVSLATDAQGRVNFVGFYGDYEVISGQQRGEFALTQGTTHYTVAVSSTSNAVGSLTAFEGSD